VEVEANGVDLFSAIETAGSDHDSSAVRPRLLLLSSEFPPGPGGIGTHAFQLARHLARFGWNVMVQAPQPYVTAAERDAFNARQPFSIAPLGEREAGTGWRVDRLREIHGAVDGFRPAILVATGHRALLTAAAIHAIYRIPWVAVGHGTEFVNHTPAARFLTRRALAGATAVIAVSEYTAGLIRDAARPRRLFVIPNAADGDRFRSGLDASLWRREWTAGDGPVLLTVGQVSERKAQDVVIRAMPRVLAERPDAHYVMAGLPSRREALESLARELGVSDRIHFTGLVADDDLPVIYNAADLFVLVSRRTADGDVEGYGIVVQEAALSGLPAVVSQGCGLTEAIREGETGLSVPPDDPEATAAAILSLLNDVDRRREMGHRARQLALSSTWSERIAEYDRVLRAILSPQPEVA